MAKYDEREITQPVLLCDAKAIWIRPRWAGRGSRFKRAIYPAISSQEEMEFLERHLRGFLDSFTIANIDYLGVGAWNW